MDHVCLAAQYAIRLQHLALTEPRTTLWWRDWYSIEDVDKFQARRPDVGIEMVEDENDDEDSDGWLDGYGYHLGDGVYQIDVDSDDDDDGW